MQRKSSVQWEGQSLAHSKCSSSVTWKTYLSRPTHSIFRGLELLRFYCAITLPSTLLTGNLHLRKWCTMERKCVLESRYLPHCILTDLLACFPSRLRATWTYGTCLTCFIFPIPTSGSGIYLLNTWENRWMKEEIVLLSCLQVRGLDRYNKLFSVYWINRTGSALWTKHI